ncbi:MAG: superinfection immunity protein, partial [Terriglobales bacterium]
MLTNAFWALVYFLPAVVGFYRKLQRAWAIFALNLLFGWTILGWIMAMAWAATPTSVLMNRSNKRVMLEARNTMVQIQKLLFPQDPETGELVRMQTGVLLLERLNNRLGIMGPDFFRMVYSDNDLEREGEIFDKLPPPQLFLLASELERLAKRVPVERGEPKEWKGEA